MKGMQRLAHVAVIAFAAPLAAMSLLGDSWRYGVIAIAAFIPLVPVVVLLLRRRFTDRMGWCAMLIGLAFLAVHNVANAYAFAAQGIQATGTASDLTLLLGYVFLLLGGMLATVPYARRDAGGMLDMTLGGLALASIVWATVLYPLNLRMGRSPGTITYEMVLLLCISALAGAVVRAAVVAPKARGASLYLFTAIIAVMGAEIGTTVTLDPVTLTSAGWVGSLCVVSYAALGAALVHPSMASITGTERESLGLTRSRLAFLGVALAVNPVIAGIQFLMGRPTDMVLLTITSLLIVPLVVARIGLLAKWHADAERRLRDLACLDELTGLANRRALTSHLAGLLERVAHGASIGAVVLYLDLDDFKSVNDTHGHAVGDELLREIARRLLGCVRVSDLVARFGGDEFVLVVEGPRSAVDSTVVPSIEHALAQPFELGGVVVSALTSLGLASVASGDRVDAQTLLGRADATMYEVKHQRRADRETLPPHETPGSLRG
ncbi:MAG: GGDEF domain-containing protein [Demequinaceae bacterium]|nr:GGDEF domain-containing protein [Demequinaceae bacterium]